MATITSAQTGNFSSTSTWVGSVVPTSADDAVAATGHVVTIDTDVTVLSFQQAGTGKFVLGGGRTVTGNVIANAGTYTTGGTIEVTPTSGNTATINGNLTGVSSTTASVAGVVITGTGSLIINGSVTGTAGTAAAAMIYTNVTCGITINGTVSSGSGEQKLGLLTGASSNANVTITTTGAVQAISGNSNAISMNGSSGSIAVTAGSILGSTTGNNGHGIVIGGAITTLFNATNILAGNNSDALRSTGATQVVNVTATTVRGVSGPGSSGRGIYLTGSAAILNLTASVVEGNLSTSSEGIRIDSGSTANVTAPTVRGSTSGGFGIYGQGASSLINVVGNLFGIGQSGSGVRSEASSANSGVVLTGNMTDSSLGATALSARIFRLNGTASGITTYTNNVGYPTGGSVTRVSPDNVTGMPAASNVRSGTAYGYNNQLTGTMAVPPRQSVSFGASVDNTTGTASLSPSDIASLVGAQIAAAVKDVN